MLLFVDYINRWDVQHKITSYNKAGNNFKGENVILSLVYYQ